MALLNADSCFIFTDTETTGLDINFSQIIQVGSVLTDDAIHTEDSQDLDCQLLPWIVPSPEAFLVHKKIKSLSDNKLSHLEMMMQLRDKWLEWSKEKNPVFITYNGHRFDEELFRRQFYWCLLPSYITNTDGATRLDLMFTFQLVANFFSDFVNVPTSEEGDISLKLTDWAEVNEISSEGAHDALNDCYLMVKMSKIIKDNANQAWRASLKGSSKAGNLSIIQSAPFAMLGEVFRKKKFTYPITFCGQNFNFPNEVAVADLYFDPDTLEDLSDTELLEQIGSSGSAIRKLKINRSLPLISSNQIPNLPNYLDISEDQLNERASKIKNNVGLQKRISELMSNNQVQYPQPRFVEQSVYSGFASNADQLWMERFHSVGWEEKAKLIEGFEDTRFKELAERLVCTNAPQSLPKESKERYEVFLKQRLYSKGPWLRLENAIAKTNQMILDATEEDKKILEKLLEHLNLLSSQ
ncbi:MAG: exonuclease domain-containing protein [SAR86 cluster bacterium]|nr:exonuclease domain-containing protein [SAR86 cluster bacterium]